MCHMKLLQKLNKNTSNCHENNGFAKRTKFPTKIIICYGKFCPPHCKTKKSNYFQFFANRTTVAYLRFMAVQPPRISDHILKSLGQFKRSSWQRENCHDDHLNWSKCLIIT